MDVIVIDSEAFDALKREFKTYVKQAVTEALAEKKAAEDWYLQRMIFSTIHQMFNPIFKLHQ